MSERSECIAKPIENVRYYRGYAMRLIHGYWEVETQDGEWLFHVSSDLHMEHPRFDGLDHYTSGTDEAQRRIDYREYRRSHCSIPDEISWRWYIWDGVVQQYPILGWEGIGTYKECVNLLLEALMEWGQGPEGWGE